MSISYDESYTQYAANPAVRSSHILAYLTSPRLYKDQIDGIAERKSKALEFGTASHMAILEPRRFAEESVLQPDTYPGKDGPKDWTYAANYCKDWRTAQEDAGKIIVNQADSARIQMMHLRMPVEVKRLLGVGQSEVVVRETAQGIDCQCRLDWYRDRNVFYEFKTTRNMDGAESAIHKYRYYIQNAFYRHVVQKAVLVPVRSAIVFAETNPPYRWRVMELDLDYVALGDVAVMTALEGIAARRKSGCWDDPEEVCQLVSPPSWMEVSEELEDEEI